MKLTYKQMFDALTDMYIHDAKYEDGGLVCCQYTEKSKCTDLREKGEMACKACVRLIVKKKVVAQLYRDNQEDQQVSRGRKNI